MSVPAWMLLGFAAWTLALLTFTVGVYRWTRIFTGRAQIAAFRSDQPEGEDWYRRAMRAHANCIENLPVFGAIVLALELSGTRGAAIDALSVIVLAARVVQSSVHVGHVQTNAWVSTRFSFYMVQAVCFMVLIGLVARHAIQAGAGG